LLDIRRQSAVTVESAPSPFPETAWQWQWGGTVRG